ncbi:DUF4357 domain-containing protein [Fructilactobacillus cliffordii]|uniref:DUF4357 domain-containing protein n=1 Tax=Fructilactobacillus cliffordii TaxID=2940299 RepID=UPI00209243AF|nr:DUF4357 domain-containing protein [Fructilactobacillus cliffordii]USS86136.1 DUF4357 domain-containing protein [Fructilactobacillus cliffordii]
MHPFTIQTYFPTGDPSGIRVAEIIQASIKAYYIPRQNLKSEIKQQPALSQSGIYVLCNGTAKIQAYVGTSTNIAKILNQHATAKETWWKIAVAFINNRQSYQLSESDFKFLEDRMSNQAKTGVQIDLVSSNLSHQSIVNPSRESDLKEKFNSIDILLRSFDLSLFTQKSATKKRAQRSDLQQIPVYLNRRDAHATGFYQPDYKSITVLAGSHVTTIAPTPSFTMNSLLEKLTKTGIIQNNQFTRDYQFKSASAAANILCKSSYSGPLVWYDQNHRTLHDLEARHAATNIQLDADQQNLFHLYYRGADAHARYNFQNKKTTVLRGTRLAPKTAKAFPETQLLTNLMQQKIIVNNLFTKDYTFPSSSTAATLICKAPMSGPSSWLNAKGIRLADLINH